MKLARGIAVCGLAAAVLSASAGVGQACGKERGGPRGKPGSGAGLMPGKGRGGCEHGPQAKGPQKKKPAAPGAKKPGGKTDDGALPLEEKQEMLAADLLLVVSVKAADDSPTYAKEVRWTVTFNREARGVGPGDFRLVADGVTGAKIESVKVAGTRKTFTVTVTRGEGAGTLGLNVKDDDSIYDAAGPKLGGGGKGNGNFEGEVYDLAG